MPIAKCPANSTIPILLRNGMKNSPSGPSGPTGPSGAAGGSGGAAAGGGARNASVTDGKGSPQVSYRHLSYSMLCPITTYSAPYSALASPCSTLLCATSPCPTSTCPLLKVRCLWYVDGVASTFESVCRGNESAFTGRSSSSKG